MRGSISLIQKSVTSNPITGWPWQPRHDRVFRVVEHPGVVAVGSLRTNAPAVHKRLPVRGIEKLDEPGEAARARIQRQCSTQRLIEIGLLPNGKRRPAGRSTQGAQP